MKNLYKQFCKQKTGWLFIAPQIILFIVFMVYPLISGLSLSTYKTGLNPNARKYVGLQNYIDLIQDDLFQKATVNTLIYVVFVGILTVGVGIFISSTVFDKSEKYMSFVRGCSYVPVLMTMVAYSIVWTWMLNPAYGLINYYISAMGHTRISFLGDVRYARTILVVIIWLFNLGQAVILLIAAMIGVPKSQLESAEIDGASRLQMIRHILLPLVKPTIFYIIIIIFIDVMKVYLAIDLMTAGGPSYSTISLMYLCYDTAFMQHNMGKAAAIGVIMFLISMLLSLTQFRLFGISSQKGEHEV